MRCNAKIDLKIRETIQAVQQALCVSDADLLPVAPDTTIQVDKLPQLRDAHRAANELFGYIGKNFAVSQLRSIVHSICIAIDTVMDEDEGVSSLMRWAKTSGDECLRVTKHSCGVRSQLNSWASCMQIEGIDPLVRERMARCLALRFSPEEVGENFYAYSTRYLIAAVRCNTQITDIPTVADFLPDTKKWQEIDAFLSRLLQQCIDDDSFDLEGAVSAHERRREDKHKRNRNLKEESRRDKSTLNVFPLNYTPVARSGDSAVSAPVIPQQPMQKKMPQAAPLPLGTDTVDHHAEELRETAVLDWCKGNRVPGARIADVILALKEKAIAVSQEPKMKLANSVRKRLLPYILACFDPRLGNIDNMGFDGYCRLYFEKASDIQLRKTDIPAFDTVSADAKDVLDELLSCSGKLTFINAMRRMFPPDEPGILTNTSEVRQSVEAVVPVVITQQQSTQQRPALSVTERTAIHNQRILDHLNAVKSRVLKLKREQGAVQGRDDIQNNGLAPKNTKPQKINPKVAELFARKLLAEASESFDGPEDAFRGYLYAHIQRALQKK